MGEAATDCNCGGAEDKADGTGWPRKPTAEIVMTHSPIIGKNSSAYSVVSLSAGRRPGCQGEHLADESSDAEEGERGAAKPIGAEPEDPRQTP